MKSLSLQIWQLSYHYTDGEPDGSPYGSEAAAREAEMGAARGRLEEYGDPGELLDAIGESNLLGAERLAELETLESVEDIADLVAALNDAEAMDLAKSLVRFTSAVYPTSIELPAADVFAALVAQVEPFKSFLRDALELRATVAAWDETDDEETRETRKRDFDLSALDLSRAGLRFSLAREPLPLCLLDIREGDLVDLKDAPACKSEDFIGAEFELFTVVEAERVDEDTVRLGFEGAAGLYDFDASADLPVIRCGGCWPDTEIKAPT